ncbi:hypothetical protein C8F01DRAFT_1139428 [Mycena amicta]|nr:hypothetical protein C8F01DRAFT_1139428 [Mycena amicta]
MSIQQVDLLFQIPFEQHGTTELISLDTGFNSGAQSTQLDLFSDMSYATSNVTLNPGSWKVRLNFTSEDPAYPGTFSVESEPFFVVATTGDKPNCTAVGGSATPSGGSAGAKQTGTGTGTGSGKTGGQSSAVALSGRDGMTVASVWLLLAVAFVL